MPSIDIKVLEGVFSEEEKAQIIAQVTSAFGTVAGAKLQDCTCVRVDEVASGDLGYGGMPMSVETARDLKLRG